MSILIKGMEMPKNCSDCPLNYDQMACIVTGTGWWSDTMVLMGFDSCKERLHDCPLIELPPHGRLVDIDKIIEDYWDGNHMEIDENDLKAISKYKVIIESERSKANDTH